MKFYQSLLLFSEILQTAVRSRRLQKSWDRWCNQST